MTLPIEEIIFIFIGKLYLNKLAAIKKDCLMKKGIILIVIILLIIPYLIYIIHFYSSIFSNDLKDWANFGTYISGVLSPFIAISIGYLSYALTHNQNKQAIRTQKIERRKQRPLISIGFLDYPDRILIEISNKGFGPAQITDYRIEYKGKSFLGFFSLLREVVIGGTFSLYTNSIIGFALSPNDRIKLFEITKKDAIENLKREDEDDLTDEDISSDDVVDYLNELRNVFAKCKLVISFDDIYKERPETIERKMDFFFRNIEN